eukprot:Skav206531  [mRNA]  locus=scaffold504:60893:61531:+ [translate_table: standard]
MKVEQVGQVIGIAQALRGSTEKGRLMDFEMSDFEPTACENGIRLAQGGDRQQLLRIFAALFQRQGKLLRWAQIDASERQLLRELQGLIPKLRDQYNLNGHFITVSNTLDILHRNEFELVPGSVKTVKVNAWLNEWIMRMQVQKIQRLQSSTSSNDVEFWKGVCLAGAFLGAALLSTRSWLSAGVVADVHQRMCSTLMKMLAFQSESALSLRN